MTILPAISVRQPWAWAILHAGKNVENRSWSVPEKYLGRPLFLHAGKKREWECEKYLRDALGLDVPGHLPLGGIVGLVQFGSVVESAASTWAERGMKNWIITAAHPLVFHPCAGSLHFFMANYPFVIEGALESMRQKS